MWIFVRLPALPSTAVIVSPPRARRVDAIVVGEEPQRIGRGALSSGRSRLPVILRALRRRDTGRDGGRASAAFVGRARELGELERALDAARAGRGATVLVAGDAGIGKTRLASELAARARDAGFEVLLGRSIDLVGTELPYQPFVEALRPLGELRPRPTAGSQLRVFEETLALLAERAAAAPVLLVLEDLHWADTSTLDLVVFLAHNLDDRRVLLLATYRADEPASAERMRRLADGVRRSGSALVLELGPLEHEELTALLAARADAPLPAALTDAIVARSEGNPFFAEELLAAAGDRAASSRAACATCCCSASPGSTARRRACCAWPRPPDATSATRCSALRRRCRSATCATSLRRAVEHGVLVADQATGSFRFRHALLAEAIYATILPGEREELHARLAEELARSASRAPAELAPHWAAAGRSAEALAASVDAAREAEAVFGLAEAHAHLERALALWPEVPDAAELAGLDLAELCAWAAELASQVGAAPRAVELARRAIELVGADDPHRAALLHVRLGEYLYETGSNDAGARRVRARGRARAGEAALAGARVRAGVARRRVDGGLAPRGVAADLPSRRSRSPGASAHGEAEVRALTVLGGDLAYLGRGEEGLAQLRQALQLAEEIGDPGAWTGRTSISPTR